MRALKLEKSSAVAASASAAGMIIDHSVDSQSMGEEMGSSTIGGLLGKRFSNDTSVEKLRADTDESNNDDDLSGDESGDDVEKRERR